MRKLYLSIIWIITLVCIVIGSVRFLGYHTPLYKDVKSGEEVLTNVIKDIEVRGNAYDIVIKKGNENKVSYRSRVTPSIKVEGEKLIITGDYKKHYLTSKSLNIEVTVKDDLNSIDLDTKQGDVDINSINVKDMKVISKAGDIDINDCIGDNLLIDTKAGDIDINRGTIQKIDVRSSAGDVDSNRTLFTNFNCTLLAGDCEVKGQEDLSDYNYNLVVKFGDIQVNGKSYSKDYINVKEGSSKSIDIEVKAGDIEVS